MNRLFLVSSLVALTAVACSKPDSGAPSAAPSGSAAAAVAPATTTAAAAAPAAPAATPYVQKGVPAGKVVVGYMADPTDSSECALATDAPEKKADFTKDGDKLAQMMKLKVVSSCPTDNVVGTCSAGFGLLVNYYGPKWTADTAKADCAKHPMQSWVN